MLPKETRGDRLTFRASLHYGNENSLKGKNAAADLLPQLMLRGTKEVEFQEFNDRLDELKASLSISGDVGTLNVSIQTERENLLEVLDLMKQALREPKLAESEFEIIRQAAITNVESGRSEPGQLATIELSRRLDPRPNDDVRYTPTIDESIERYKNVSIDDVRSLHTDFLNGEHGEIVVIGDFDAAATKEKLNSVFAGWKSDQPYKRIENPANPEAMAGRFDINTPDKANAFYLAAITAPISDADADYEALLIGNYIMGGGPLSSRIADRVRKKDGLSYTARSSFSADALDDRAIFNIFCISNPMNTERVVETVKEEVDKMLASGVTVDELNRAKESYLENRQGGRAEDRRLAAVLLENLQAGRDMKFHKFSDEKIETLSKDRVDAALKKLVDPSKMIIVTAGDFSKKDEESDDK